MNRTEWKPIPKFPEYLVSRRGEIFSVRMDRGLRPWRHNRGYFAITLSRGGRASKFLVHALVMLAFRGPRPTGAVINHRNGRKRDNRLDNLEYVSSATDKRHMHRVLRRRTAHGRPSLEGWELALIRRWHEDERLTMSEIGRRTGYHKTTIRLIVRRLGCYAAV